MAGLAQFLSMLAPGAAVQAPAAYDAQLTPEANAMAGAAKPAAPKAPGFQRPKGFGKTVGTIADILAVLGGQEAGYKTAIDAQEKQFNADRKTQSLSQFLMNPTDPEATNAFIEADPEGYMGYIKEMTPKAAAVSPSGEIQLLDRLISEGMPRDQAVQTILDNRRKNVQLVNDGSGQYYVDPRTRKPVALEGVGPKPFAPPAPQITYLPGADGQYYAANARAPGMAAMGVGVPVKGTGGQPKQGGKTDPEGVKVLLAEAATLLPRATGSGIGALADTAAGFLGKSTEGARATAQLSAISGALLAKMPRMEGPQSDKDVQLYKQAAGDLANATTPRETRQAALATIQKLNRKYAMGGQSSASAPTTATGPNGEKVQWNGKSWVPVR